MYFHKSVVFAGTDFQLTNVGRLATVSSDPDDPGRCFMISITDDNDPEGTEQFTISFVVDFIDPPDINNTRITRNPIQATIFIQDNDGKLYWWDDAITDLGWSASYIKVVYYAPMFCVDGICYAKLSSVRMQLKATDVMYLHSSYMYLLFLFYYNAVYVLGIIRCTYYVFIFVYLLSSLI